MFGFFQLFLFLFSSMFLVLSKYSDNVLKNVGA